MKKVITINGMHCSSCAMLIEEEFDGKVNSIKVSVMDKKATIDFDEKKITLSHIKETISKMGYKVGE